MARMEPFPLTDEGKFDYKACRIHCVNTFGDSRFLKEQHVLFLNALIETLVDIFEIPATTFCRKIKGSRENKSVFPRTLLILFMKRTYGDILSGQVIAAFIDQNHSTVSIVEKYHSDLMSRLPEQYYEGYRNAFQVIDFLISANEILFPQTKITEDDLVDKKIAEYEKLLTYLKVKVSRRQLYLYLQLTRVLVAEK